MKDAKAFIRPFLTIMFSASWILFLFMIYTSGGTYEDIPTEFTVFTFGLVLWWFGERFILHNIMRK